MKAAVVVLCAALALGGCSARYTTSASAGQGSGSTSAGGSVQVQSGPNSSLAAAILAITLLAGAIEYSRGEPRPFPSPAALLPEGREPPPELAPGRVVSEQDCTRPIDPASGNLRCR